MVPLILGNPHLLTRSKTNSCRSLEEHLTAALTKELPHRDDPRHRPATYLWLAENEGMEKKMETTIMLFLRLLFLANQR